LEGRTAQASTMLPELSIFFQTPAGIDSKGGATTASGQLVPYSEYSVEWHSFSYPLRSRTGTPTKA
jgi:hypothetical protein